jgi:hypothetical protein
MCRAANLRQKSLPSTAQNEGGAGYARRDSPLFASFSQAGLTIEQNRLKSPSQAFTLNQLALLEAECRFVWRTLLSVHKFRLHSFHAVGVLRPGHGAGFLVHLEFVFHVAHTAHATHRVNLLRELLLLLLLEGSG